MSDKEKKNSTVIVNGRKLVTPKDEISYEEIVTFIYPDFPKHPENNYAVTYKKGHGNSPEGILLPGKTVKVKDGMEFKVSETGQS
jgi:hypothetical protein